MGPSFSFVFILFYAVEYTESLVRVAKNTPTVGTVLLEGHVYTSVSYLNPYHAMDIYCYRGEPFSYPSFFTSVGVEFQRVPQQYTVFKGADEDAVLEAWNNHRPSSDPMLLWRQKTIGIPAFDHQCIGIETDDDYSFKLVVTKVNYAVVFQLCIGALLFFKAPYLCRSAVVFYTTGIGFGVIASLFIAVFVLIRCLPGKLTKVTALAVICCFHRYLLNLLLLLRSNLYENLIHYKHSVIGYLIFSAVVSFAICYRFGPPSNPKTLNLIQWSVQLAATALVYFSSEARLASGTVVILMIVTYALTIRAATPVARPVSLKEEFEGEEIVGYIVKKLPSPGRTPLNSTFDTQRRHRH